MLADELTGCLADTPGLLLVLQQLAARHLRSRSSWDPLLAPLSSLERVYIAVLWVDAPTDAANLHARAGQRAERGLRAGAGRLRPVATSGAELDVQSGDAQLLQGDRGHSSEAKSMEAPQSHPFVGPD